MGQGSQVDRRVMKYTYSHGVYKDGNYIITLKWERRRFPWFRKEWGLSTYIGGTDREHTWIDTSTGNRVTGDVAWKLSILKAMVSQPQVPSDQGSEP